MTHITLVKPSNRCNIWPILHWLNRLTGVIYGPTNTEATMTTQEKHLWFVLRLFYCLVWVSRYFFPPPSDEVTTSFSLSFDLLFRSKLSRFRFRTRTLNSYKTVTSLPSKLQKTLLSHPHLVPRLQRQVCVSSQRVNKIFSYFITCIQREGMRFNTVRLFVPFMH